MENKDRDLFRLSHIQECIEKIEFLVDKLKTYDNFEKMIFY